MDLQSYIFLQGYRIILSSHERVSLYDISGADSADCCCLASSAACESTITAHTEAFTYYDGAFAQQSILEPFIILLTSVRTKPIRFSKVRSSANSDSLGDSAVNFAKLAAYLESVRCFQALKSRERQTYTFHFVAQFGKFPQKLLL